MFCDLRRITCLLLLFPLAIFSQSNQSGSQDDSAKTVVKANTRQVVVDVIATDSKGNPVTGLESTNFTVLENGRRQTISDFTFKQPGEVQTVSQVHLPANVYTNVPATTPSSVNVILLDALNGEFSSRAYALRELMKFLEDHPAIQPTAIYLMEQNIKLLHDFTTDTDQLKEVLANFHPQVAPRVDNVYAAATPFTQHGVLQATPQTIQATLEALKFLARSLAAYPGRKNLIWLSEAFPITLFPDDMKGGPSDVLKTQDVMGSAVADTANIQTQLGKYSEYAVEVEKTANLLMSSQIAVYPIDAAGVGRISRVDALTTMRSMADRTGGKTFASQNDLDLSIRGSMNDGSTYYTLAYYPDDKTWNGKFRQIEIKTDHPGINLRYRSGYYASDPGAETGNDSKKLGAEFSQALSLDSPSATVVLFQATVTPPAASGQKTLVSFSIDPRTLTYAQKEQGIQQASFGCAIAAYTDKGARVRYEMNNIEGRVKTEDYPRLMRSKVPCQCTIDLKSGKYKLRVGVVDKNGGQIGTTNASVTVP